MMLKRRIHCSRFRATAVASPANAEAAARGMGTSVVGVARKVDHCLGYYTTSDIIAVAVGRLGEVRAVCCCR